VSLESDQSFREDGVSDVNTAPRIFLSYAREDADKVKSLYQRLSNTGFTPWIDTEDILPGERWEISIQRAIRQADFFLVCLSENAVNKRGMLQKEIKAALEIWQEKLEHDIYLIPVRLEDCHVPEALRDFQWVNLFETDGWSRLETAIQVGIERRSEGVNHSVKNKQLQINLQPDELIKGDNQVTLVIRNRSQDTCEELSIRLIGDNLLYVGRRSRIQISLLRPNEEFNGTINLAALDVGSAVMKLQCSWKQQSETFYQNFVFQLRVVEDTFRQEAPSEKPDRDVSYLKDHYLGALPHWKELLQSKQKEYQHLEIQAAKWGELDVPFRIVSQMESLEKEISELRKKIEKGEAYLRHNT